MAWRSQVGEGEAGAADPTPGSSLSTMLRMVPLSLRERKVRDLHYTLLHIPDRPSSPSGMTVEMQKTPA